MVICKNGKRFPVRALEFRGLPATMESVADKSVYRVSVAAPAEVAANAGAL